MGDPVPYGNECLHDKSLVLLPEQFKDVENAYRDFLNGVSIGSIVDDFNEHGLPWNHTAMRNILKRATYAGKSAHQGKLIGDSKTPAIVSEADWLASCQILADPTRRRNAESRVRWLLGRHPMLRRLWRAYERIHAVTQGADQEQGIL